MVNEHSHTQEALHLCRITPAPLPARIQNPEARKETSIKNTFRLVPVDL
jgi:hypothetical protein